MKKLVCFHLLNDYSGSPRVLGSVIAGLCERGYFIDLVTTKNGILDKIVSPNLKHCYFRYSFSRNKLITLLRWLNVQIYFFNFTLQYKKQNVCFYINTILPVGAVLAAKLIKKEVIYHYHENAYAKGRFYIILANIMQKKADKIICVSNYQRSFLQRTNDVFIVPNALSSKFYGKLYPQSAEYAESAFERKNILMLSSLKRYKGIIQFVQLACMLPEFSFTIVINDTEQNINKFFSENDIVFPENLLAFPRQIDVVKFYKAGSVGLNLSDASCFIETFGLTTLESFSAGLPVIVPEVGGIAEIVEDEVNGWKISVHHLNKIADCLKKLLKDKGLYIRCAHNALEKSKEFSMKKMLDSIQNIIEKDM